MRSRMIMRVVASLFVSLTCAGEAEGQPGGNNPGRTAQEAMDARRAALSRLLGTVAGIDNSQARPWVRKDTQGFVRFLSAPAGGHFQVAGVGQQSPEEVADAFIAQNRPLLARDVNAVGFKRYRISQNGGRSFIRYRQTYGGLEVHASTVIVQVKSFPRAVSDRYQLRSGYRLDEATGQFLDQRTGQVVPREQAIEFYNARDQTYYDLQGRPLRTDQAEQPQEYVTEYGLDRQTGEVKQMRRPVRQTYIFKKGFRLDNRTGQFVDEATGNAVAAQDALVLIRR